jgi:cation transport regulator ChaB
MHEPYHELDDLPQSLRRTLPEDAQRMYLAVFRRVWETTAMSGERADSELDETAHEAAMLEVQRRFEQDGQGNWVQAPVDKDIDPDKLEGGVPDHE